MEKAGIIIAVVVILAALTFLIFRNSPNNVAGVCPEVVDFEVSKDTVYEEEPVFFTNLSDSEDLFWDFGDDAFTRDDNKVLHKFRYAGEYEVKLVVNSNQECTVSKYIVVAVDSMKLNATADNDPQPVEDFKPVIRKNAPSVRNNSAVASASGQMQIVPPLGRILQGKSSSFSINAPGGASTFEWRFGETGRVDSRERVAQYAFLSPGLKTIELRTDGNKYPIILDLEVHPSNSTGPIKNISTASSGVLEQDFLGIFDQMLNNDSGRSHKKLWKTLKEKACNNQNITVNLSTGGQMELYNYCNSLLISSSESLKINGVNILLDQSSGCAKLVQVNQTKLN